MGACPLLQEYGNIAYQPDRRRNGAELEQQMDKYHAHTKKSDLMKPVLPIISIEMPDWIEGLETVRKKLIVWFKTNDEGLKRSYDNLEYV